MFPLFLCFFLCGKYDKPITVQYCIADCIGWVPQLTSLDLQTNWTYKQIGLTNTLLEGNLLAHKGLAVQDLHQASHLLSGRMERSGAIMLAWQIVSSIEAQYYCSF